MVETLAAIAAKLKPFIPGLLGAFLAALTGPQRSRALRAIEFAFGFCSSLFLTDPALDLLALSPDKYSGGIGFLLGYFGMTIAQAILRATSETEWGKALASRIGGGQ